MLKSICIFKDRYLITPLYCNSLELLVIIVYGIKCSLYLRMTVLPFKS